MCLIMNTFLLQIQYKINVYKLKCFFEIFPYVLYFRQTHWGKYVFIFHRCEKSSREQNFLTNENIFIFNQPCKCYPLNNQLHYASKPLFTTYYVKGRLKYTIPPSVNFVFHCLVYFLLFSSKT